MISENYDIVLDEITLESNFKEDLNLDSLDFVEVIMEIEDTFHIEIDDHDAKELATVEDMVSYIAQQIESKSTV